MEMCGYVCVRVMFYIILAFKELLFVELISV
jgi:hypothetical protein